MKNNLDQFYTQEKVAKFCSDIVKAFFDISEYKILEPSAGEGVFLKFFDNFYACDIDPKNDLIEKKDFLKDDIKDKLGNDKIITIGNPPFGKRSKLAIEFINKSFEYSDIVSFILPIHFLKYSAQYKIRNDAKLICSELLDEDSFIYNGKNYSVRCCFQIWTLLDTEYKDLRIKESPVIKHDDFDMWQYNNTKLAEKYFDKTIYNWDFAVPRQGYKDYNIRETDPNKMDKHTQWIFFKANNKEILERLMSLDFEKISKNNTSTPGFGKADVIKEYNNKFKK